LILSLSYVGHCGLGGEFECGITHAVLVPRVSLPSVPRLSESWDEAQQKPRQSYSIPDRWKTMGGCSCFLSQHVSGSKAHHLKGTTASLASVPWEFLPRGSRHCWSLWC